MYLKNEIMVDIECAFINQISGLQEFREHKKCCSFLPPIIQFRNRITEFFVDTLLITVFDADGFWLTVEITISLLEARCLYENS